MTSQNDTVDAQIKRISLATGIKSQQGLARLLGVRQSAISDARRRGRIPYNWLLTLLISKGITPDWVRSGQGEIFIPSPDQDKTK